MGWLGFAIIVFLILIIRRQSNDGFLSGMGFNFIGSIAGGLGLYIGIITIFGSARWALIAGVIGAAAGGWLIGLIAPEDGGDYG